MFLVSLISDTIPTAPSEINLDVNAVLTSCIQAKYVNKVIDQVGLVVGIYDILRITDSIILPADGRVHYKVNFRLIIFKPFLGEILDGTLIEANSSGMKVSLQFFQDIKLHPDAIRNPRGFDKEEERWWWEYEDHRLYYELNQKIRFQVVEVLFPHNNSFAAGKQKSYEPPMIINASVEKDGLGMRSWWE
ncbi:Rna polymerase Rpb7, N-terminal domain-containing protein [Cardiosporidium cionae]|uniref:Rna polymerase Rpb7, N-terminal domain-containing protein n=1 Tax=Cardiosporidium cionae TaxID=476202 RepID=A0ABQ7J835_9APIC|nr:Rna polymerase Rpb7, N-terminal domain-containing protein [Cardiosporidium cionae]|eukprot:KAF8820129.1 Rna polymerase Rpb7, N-terminal domain-containing protein [Cardiosporidium cionae]